MATAEAENSSYIHFSQSQAQWLHMNILKDTNTYNICLFCIFSFRLCLPVVFSSAGTADEFPLLAQHKYSLKK